MLYLARIIVKGKRHYIIRESYFDGSTFRHRDLFDLGGHPEEYIRYPGGNAYYIDSCIEEEFLNQGLHIREADLDELFRPFLDPRIRRVIESFSRNTRSGRPKIDADVNSRGIDAHHFDKRRMLYLRCARMDQGNINHCPPKMLAALENKSRDEIEQYFMELERVLRPSDLKAYVFVIFNLQRHFFQAHARKYPQMLDGSEMDEHFLKDFCALTEDAVFRKGFENVQAGLRDYLNRYLVMYFDYDFGQSGYLEDYINQFMNSRRQFSFPKVVNTIGWEEAAIRLKIEKSALKKLTRRELTVHYRKMAMRIHPDKGGDHHGFIKLTEAYKEVIKRLSR